MANHMDNITQAMNAIILEDEEEGGVVVGDFEESGYEEQQIVCDAKLCLVGRFLTEGMFDFRAMQQTLAALWRPGKGVHIKALEANLFLFQFYHEIDIKRVIEGSPWSFNRKVLLIGRMQESVNPRSIPLNSIDLWVQIHDMQPGFMSEKIIREIGNQVGVYVSSCPNNFKSIWREYMRIRVTIDVGKPLKRKMKIRKSGNEWSWVTFKYENLPTFCFICGVLGHSDKFCSRLFEVPENEITKPYGVWMRAPLRRPNMEIGSKWLRNGADDSSFKEMATSGASGSNTKGSVMVEKSVPKNTGSDEAGLKKGDSVNQNNAAGEISGILKFGDRVDGGKIFKGSNSVILENKKRRTDSGTENMLGLNTEIDPETDTEETVSMEQDVVNGPKNGFVAGSEDRARLSS